MTRVIMPLMSQDARGSVAGMQFSRNRSGNFGSRKSTSTRAQSDGATNWRANIKAAHTAWHALSASDRLSWEQAASATVTPRNAFIGCYLRNIQATVLQLGAWQPPDVRRWVSALAVIPPAIGGDGWMAFWNTGGEGNQILKFHVHNSWSPRPHVHRRKFRFVRASPASTAFDAWTDLRMDPFPVILVELIDPATGTLISSWRLDPAL